jgi:pimeloyl-ACP methyl ester carboxylesterase
VHRDLLAAAKEEPGRAYQMMTAWAHGTAAKLGGHPVPGLWMTGGTLALFARNQPGVLHADLEACNAWKSGPDAARKVRCPALVIIAANDIMTPAKAGQELARLIAGSRAITVENCGHMLPAEAPDAVLDALIDFFAPAKVG